jgi:hypothetical protein
MQGNIVCLGSKVAIQVLKTERKTVPDPTKSQLGHVTMEYAYVICTS